MDIKLIASDLDCTIIDKNNNISTKNIDAIQNIHSKKIDFVVCTGKSFLVSKNICKKFKADYGIFGNGTQIIDFKNKKEIFKKTLSKEDLLFIATIAKRYNFHLHLYTSEDVVTESLEYMDLRNFILQSENTEETLNFKIVDDIVKYIEEYHSTVFSAIVSSEKNTLDDFQKIMTINENINFSFINKRGIYRDNIINKDYEYIIISPSNVNKDEALNFLCNHLNIDKSKETIAVGDNVNDLEMVKNAAIGIAVSESYDELKNVATYVTESSVTDGAFAEGINKYLEN